VVWKRPSVLVVEDDLEMRNLLFEELWNEGYQLREAKDGEEALRAAVQAPPDLILTDLRMPQGGVEYVHQLHRRLPHCPIVVMTAFGDDQSMRDVLAAGAAAYLSKPVHLSELKARVRDLLSPALHTSGGGG
jgi:DNA-binding response OmpR family regulator